MTNKQLATAAAVVGLVLAAIIVLLLTGGGSIEERPLDDADDVQVGQGAAAPTEVSLADVRSTQVRREGEDIVFEAEMAGPVPAELSGQTLTWRWVILEDGTETWVVSADVSVGRPVARVLGQQVNYGASTIDDTLPGEIERDGNTMIVRIRSAEIERFPSEFAWRLETALDGDRRDPRSATATDTAPASGLGSYPPE